MDEENEKRIATLIGSIAKAIEGSDYTHREVQSALIRLHRHYRDVGEEFLADAQIKDVAWHRQHLFEQRNTTPSDKDVAELKGSI